MKERGQWLNHTNRRRIQTEKLSLFRFTRADISPISFKSNHKADKRKAADNRPSRHQTHSAFNALYTPTVCLFVWLYKSTTIYRESTHTVCHRQCFECKGSYSSLHITKTDWGRSPSTSASSSPIPTNKIQKEKKNTNEIKSKKKKKEGMWNGTSLCRNPICIVKRHTLLSLLSFHLFFLVILSMCSPDCIA